MREKDLTAAVRPFEDRFVLLVGAVPAEHDEGEALRCRELPAGIFLNPAREEIGEADVLALEHPKPFGAVTPQHGPELERAEAAAQRGAVLRKCVRVLRSSQELG